MISEKTYRQFRLWLLSSKGVSIEELSTKSIIEYWMLYQEEHHGE